ncbi:glycoside hydrolase family 5 protein [Methylorubrum sp. SB2]|uniref:glycoside hydrolase family 5 protein n=1 Tax=Methylorubrum subtropicum TaxID=3138812 RepID=UPI00313D2ECA
MPTRRTLLAAALAAALPARAGPAGPRLRRGISLWPWFSLTKEYPAPRTDYAWPPFQVQRPVPRRDDLRRLAQAGFDFVRIPVDPGPFLAFEGTPFRRRLLDEVEDAVGLCLAAGLDTIVNVQINEATHHWNSRRLIASREAADYPAYRALVVELARRLDPARTVLEPVNEPPQACGSAEWAALQRDLLAAARAAAPALTLTTTGACGSMVPGLQALDPKPLAGLRPLTYIVHFYEPYLFTHQGAPWMRGEPIYRALNAVPWPASAGTLEETLAAVRRRMAQDRERPAAEAKAAYAETEAKMQEYFDARPDRDFLIHGLSGVRDWAKANGVAPERILIGEFGALRSDARYVAAGAADRARYIRDLRETIEGYGFGWAYWNFFDGFGLVTDDATRDFDPAVVAALGLRMPR